MLNFAHSKTIFWFIFFFLSTKWGKVSSQLVTVLEHIKHIIEDSGGVAARSVTVKPTGCGFDPHSRRWNIYLNLYFHFFALVSRLSAALSSATPHAMPPEFGRKWGMECLNTKFPLPTLLCAGYSVKLIFFTSEKWQKIWYLFLFLFYLKYNFKLNFLSASHCITHIAE